jgi:hypothetical protein
MERLEERKRDEVKRRRRYRHAKREGMEERKRKIEQKAT